MLPDKQMNFLKEKIMDTKTALFMSLADSVLKMPVCIVNTLYMDEVGQIWFCISRPQQVLSEFDSQFPVELNYYRKGNPFTLKVYGRAYFVDDPEELEGLRGLLPQFEEINLKESVIIRVKMSRADYFERKEGEANRFWAKVRENFNQWFFNNQPQIHLVSFQPEASF